MEEKRKLSHVSVAYAEQTKQTVQNDNSRTLDSLKESPPLGGGMWAYWYWYRWCGVGKKIKGGYPKAVRLR
jgi:hypothetical protein